MPDTEALTVPPAGPSLPPVVIAEDDTTHSIPPGSDPVAANAAAILQAIADVAGGVAKLSGAFESFKIETQTKILFLERRVDGSVPPGPLTVPVSDRLTSIEKTLRDQNAAMGLGLQGFNALFGPSGRKAASRVATMIAAIYVALQVGGWLPSRAPSSAAPAPAQTVYVLAVPSDAGAVVH